MKLGRAILLAGMLSVGVVATGAGALKVLSSASPAPSVSKAELVQREQSYQPNLPEATANPNAASALSSCPAPAPHLGIYPADGQFPNYRGVNLGIVVGSDGPDPYYIHAGSASQNSLQGEIVMLRVAADTCKGLRETGWENQPLILKYPVLAGAITISSVQGDVLSLRTASGLTPHFNFVTRQFLP